MHAVIRGTSGISALQNLKASPVQACRCSGVPSAYEAPEDKTISRATAILRRAATIAIAPSILVGFAPMLAKRAGNNRMLGRMVCLEL
jgi:hypothetical protein